MTYGVLPSREDFGRAFQEETPDGFRFGNDSRVGTGSMTADELWDELARARAEYEEAGDEAAGDWCSAVLGRLGYEWV